VLIPFKGKARKSRLSGLLGPPDRCRFAETMLLDVLDACRSAGLIGHSYVVSSDHTVLGAAVKTGANAIAEPSERGVNFAVDWATRKLKEHDEFMVLPSDLPWLRPSELRAALSWKSQFDLLLSPSRHFDGTNLLIFSRQSAIPLSYDSDSFWNHVAGAARKNLSLAVYCGMGVMSDVDSAEDFIGLSRARINTRSASFARKVLATRDSS